MKLVFVINSLSAGGAERILSILANTFCAEGNQVSIITFTLDKPFFKLDPKIDLIPLGFSVKEKHGLGKIIDLFKLIRRLGQEIKRVAPNRIICFMDQANILTLLAARGCPVIVSERIYPAYSSLLENRSGFLAQIVKIFRNLIYRRASKIVVLTESARAYFPASLRSKITVIPNPVLNPEIEDADRILPSPSIVSIGRLTKQKRFDRLIGAFAEVYKKFPEWSLTIFGEGELRKELQAQVNQLNLSHKISLPGLTRTPCAVLKQAEIFVLCSDYEGFPGGLAQAMSVGLAAVATDCKSGPAEIIENGVNGILVGTMDNFELVRAVSELVANPQLRQKLGADAKSICGRYTLEQFIKQWKESVGLT